MQWLCFLSERNCRGIVLFIYLLAVNTISIFVVGGVVRREYTYINHININ